MKKIFLFAASIVLLGTLFLSSCSKTDDPATNPASTEPQERFVGNWYISEHSSYYNSNATYYDNISDSTNSSYLLHKYLYGYHTSIRSTFSGNNFTIPSQTVEGQSVSGSGTLTSSNRINMTYIVWLGSTHYDTVTAVLTK